MRIPIVISDDYPALKCICEPRIAGNNYNEYLAKICARRDALQGLGVTVEFVLINPRSFLTHFTEKKPATWPDLLRYTYHLPQDSSSSEPFSEMRH